MNLVPLNILDNNRRSSLFCSSVKSLIAHGRTACVGAVAHIFLIRSAKAECDDHRDHIVLVMGKKSRKPNKKTKEERERELSERKLVDFFRTMTRRLPIPIGNCSHTAMTVTDEEQTKQVKIYVAQFSREFYAFMVYGSRLPASSPTRDQSHHLLDFVSSPAACRNIEGMAQSVLAVATDYLLQYDDYKVMRTIFNALLEAYGVLKEMIEKNIDPSDSRTVMAVILCTYQLLFNSYRSAFAISHALFRIVYAPKTTKRTTTPCATRSMRLPSFYRQPTPAIALGI